MKKQLLLLSLLFFYTLMAQAQNLLQPVPGFTHACISNSFNDFEVAFSFTGGAFNSDNSFFIELSDAAGNFSGATLLRTVSDKNNAYEFRLSLQFPETLAGNGYRIRIRSTSPAMTSEATRAFEAYFVADTQLVLNNYEASGLCASEPTLLELNEDVADSYIWYRDGLEYSRTAEPYLTVDVAGQYYVEPDLGSCTGSLISNIVLVQALEPIDVSLGVNEEILTCTGEQVSLRAASDDPLLTYQWFLNDEALSSPVTGSSAYSFTAGADTFGTYFLKASNAEGCTAVSALVIVREKESLQITQVSPRDVVILGDVTADLKLEANQSELEVVWFRDGIEVGRGIDRLGFSADQEGVYHAEVTNPGGCSATMLSAEFYVFEPQSFTAYLGFDSQYVPCESITARISLQSLQGILSNGDRFIIDPSLYHLFDLNWNKDGVHIASGLAEIMLDDHTATGAYHLEVVYGGETFRSDLLEAHIGLPEAELQQESVLTCREPALLRVMALEDVIYSWYLNDALVYSGLDAFYDADVPGVYRVEMEYLGCVASTPGKEVVSEQDALVSVYPGERVALVPDEEVELMAEGAEKYIWTSASGEVLSQGASLTVNDQGTYYLTAISGGCETQKTVEVHFNLATAIPNVVTPNNDSVNDRWILPQKLLDDPELQVIICDSYGNPVLKTNNYDNSWPASLDQLSSGDPNYFYILNKGGQNLQKGMITLVR